jgi:hypothetical protein
VNNHRPPARYNPPTNGSILANTTRCPRAAANTNRPNRTGHDRRCTRCNRTNASTGNSSNIRFPARSATTRVTCSGANRPATRANSATNRATVRDPSINPANTNSSGVNRR